ncbi:MAG: BT4734/BF3469 family protein [Vicingaceae bacterium]
MEELGKITVFKNIWEISDPLFVDYITILKRIKDGNSKNTIERIRSSESKDEKQSLKKRLPSVCWSGRFSKRDANYFLEHSGIICLDVDDLKIEDIESIKDLVCGDFFTLACFVSPGGKGIKILIKIVPDKENHRGQFLALEKHYNEYLKSFTSTKKNEKKVGEITKKIDESQGDFLRAHIDPSGKDINRVCYESFDLDIYHNPDSDLWYETLEKVYEQKEVDDVDEVITILQNWADRKSSYYEGNRNNFVYVFASALCRFGVNELRALDYLNAKYDLPEGEMRTTVKSAYKSNDFGTEFFTEKEKKTKIANIEIESKKPVTAFWSVDEKMRVKIDTKQFLEYIAAEGFGIYRNRKGSGKIQFVQTKNMIVDIVDVIDIKKEILDFVQRKAPEPVFHELQMKNRYFENTFLNALPEINIEQIRDEKESCYFFFDGFYFEVTMDEIKKHDYINLKGRHIWKSQLCKKTVTEIIDPEKSDFRNFVYNATGKTKDNFINACSALGYGLHTYKKKRLAKMIYTCDASQGELEGLAEGGTGKNLFLECLSMARSTAFIDGKDFDKRDKFKFQTVDYDTQTVNIDDYEGNIKELFTKVTGHFEIEKKGQDKVVIEFENAPKILVSSNQAPEGFSNSFKRRIHLVEFSDYYKEGFSPADEFGDKDFFSDDWNQHDWNGLYSFLFKCAQYYLKYGLKETEIKDNTRYKQLVKTVGREFADYHKDYDISEWKNIKNIHISFIEHSGEGITIQKYTSNLRKMCAVYKWRFDVEGSGYDKKIRIIKKV